MNARREWTLSEAAKVLRQPQHKLIYLCEKGVVLPDLGGATGRGSSRRFSARNLLEFALALKLRELSIPVSPIAVILEVLRGFEKKVARDIQGFNLPGSLREARALDLRIVIGDGQRLFFSLGAGKTAPKVYGGLEFKVLAAGRTRGRRRGPVRPSSGKAPAEIALVPVKQDVGEQAGSWVSVTKVARGLPLEQ